MNENNDIFFKIWRNLFLKKIIQKEIKLFNQHNSLIKFKKNIIIQYKYRDYITNLSIKIENNDELVKIINLFPFLTSLTIKSYTTLASDLKYDNDDYGGNDEEQEEMKKHSLLNIKKLVMWDLFNDSLSNLLSFRIWKLIFKQLERLEFGSNFQQPIEANTLPSTLKTLKFKNEYNQPINFDNIPSSITNLNFGMNFNQSFQDNNLINLKKLNLGGFYYPVNNNHPNELKIGQLSNSIKKLQIGSNFIISTPETIPKSVSKLMIVSKNEPSKSFIECIPSKSLKSFTSTIEFSKGLLHHFTSLKHLTILKMDELKFENIFKRIKLPESLESFSISLMGCDLNLSMLPSNCKTVSIEFLSGRVHTYCIQTIFTIPPTIENLSIIGIRDITHLNEFNLHSNFSNLSSLKLITIKSIEIKNHDILPIFPISLKSVKLFTNYLNLIPNNIHSLSIQLSNYYFKNVFEYGLFKNFKNLKLLEIKPEVNKVSITIKNLPDSLENLILKDINIQDIIKLPKNLKSIYIENVEFLNILKNNNNHIIDKLIQYIKFRDGSKYFNLFEKLQFQTNK